MSIWDDIMSALPDRAASVLPPLLNNADEFHEWLLTAKCGEPCVYHIGELHLASDIKRAVWAAALKGLVNLVQRRHAKNCFMYIAQRSAQEPYKRAIPRDYGEDKPVAVGHTVRHHRIHGAKIQASTASSSK